MNTHALKSTIQAVTKKSQLANHAVMKIHVTRTTNNDLGYLYTKSWMTNDSLLYKRPKREIQLCRVHCNPLKIVISLPPPYDFFKLCFHVKSCVLTCSLCESLSYFYFSRCEIDRSINRIGKSPPHLGYQIAEEDIRYLGVIIIERRPTKEDPMPKLHIENSN